MNMGQTECSETSAYKIQTPGNYPEESIQQVLSSRHFRAKIFLVSSPAINVMSLTAPQLSMLHTSLSKRQKITLIDQFLTQFALREKHSNQTAKLSDNKVLVECLDVGKSR